MDLTAVRRQLEQARSQAEQTRSSALSCLGMEPAPAVEDVDVLRRAERELAGVLDELDSDPLLSALREGLDGRVERLRDERKQLMPDMFTRIGRAARGELSVEPAQRRRRAEIDDEVRDLQVLIEALTGSSAHGPAIEQRIEAIGARVAQLTGAVEPIVELHVIEVDQVRQRERERAQERHFATMADRLGLDVDDVEHGHAPRRPAALLGDLHERCALVRGAVRQARELARAARAGDSFERLAETVGDELASSERRIAAVEDALKSRTLLRLLADDPQELLRRARRTADVARTRVEYYEQREQPVPAGRRADLRKAADQLELISFVHELPADGDGAVMLFCELGRVDDLLIEAQSVRDLLQSIHAQIAHADDEAADLARAPVAALEREDLAQRQTLSRFGL